MDLREGKPVKLTEAFSELKAKASALSQVKRHNNAAVIVEDWCQRVILSGCPQTEAGDIIAQMNTLPSQAASV